MPVPLSWTVSLMYFPGSDRFFLPGLLRSQHDIFCSDGQYAAGGHGLVRVDGQIVNHLAYLSFIGLDKPDVFRNVEVTED